MPIVELSAICPSASCIGSERRPIMLQGEMRRLFATRQLDQHAGKYLSGRYRLTMSTAPRGRAGPFSWQLERAAGGRTPS